MISLSVSTTSKRVLVSKEQGRPKICREESKLPRIRTIAFTESCLSTRNSWFNRVKMLSRASCSKPRKSSKDSNKSLSQLTRQWSNKRKRTKVASINSNLLMLISRAKCKQKTNNSYRNTNITLPMWTWPRTSWGSIENWRRKSRCWDTKNGWTISTKSKIVFNSSRMMSCIRSKKNRCLSHKWRPSSKVCRSISSKTQIISPMTFQLKSASLNLLVQCSLCLWRHRSSYSKNKKN